MKKKYIIPAILVRHIAPTNIMNASFGEGSAEKDATVLSKDGGLLNLDDFSNFDIMSSGSVFLPQADSFNMFE